MYINLLVLISLFLGAVISFFFKKWLGPLGVFLVIQLFTFLSLIDIIFIFSKNLYSTVILFLDYGYWFRLSDFYEAHICIIYDNLSITLTGLVILLTLLIQYFSLEYMYREAFCTRLLYLIQFFAFSVILLFLVYDYFILLLAWELIGLFSLLLVNFYFVRVHTLKAALKTFMFSRISDFFILLPIFFFILCFQSTDFSVIFIFTPFFIFYYIFIGSFSVSLLSLISISLVFAGCIKGAQFISHVWLPDAMEAPTPASALIHSSTLVIMGVYVFIRFGLFFELTPLVSYMLSIWGSLSIVIGAISASFQSDLKKLIAYSTISQIGYLCCGCGFLCFTEVLNYLIIHALNKALIFIFVGYIVHLSLGNTDIRFISSLYYKIEDASFCLLFLAFSLTGLPLSAGFFTKEALLLQTFSSNSLLFFTKVAWFLGILFTILYFITFIYSIFFSARPLHNSLTQNKYIWLKPQQSCINLYLYFYRNLDRTLLYSKISVLLYIFIFFLIQIVGELVFISNYGLLLFSHLQSWTFVPNNTFFDNFSLVTYSWYFWINLWVLSHTLIAVRYYFLSIIN